MNDIIKKVNTRLVFNFANGDTYELPLKNETTNPLSTYGTSIKLKEQLYKTSGTNIVGNICCNSLDIELVSNDNLLISTNENSQYYGYMDDTAYIDVYCYVVDDDYTEYMGRYFVDAWENGNTSSESKKVSISCVDILSKIKNIGLGKIRLKRNISFNDYLRTIIDTLNQKTSAELQVLYDNNDINLFSDSQYDWQMYFNNIDRNDIESLFNNIAKNTISYIWIARNRHIKTDNLLDDISEQSVCSITGSTNLFEYGSQSGDIDKYSGVNVTYITNVGYEDKQLLSLKDYALLKGTNEITNATLNSNKVINIHHIEITCAYGNAVCTSFENYKNSIDMEIESTAETTCSIDVYGTIINETTDIITMYKNDNKKSNTVEIENLVLRKEIIPTYVSGLIQLMSMKNNKMYATGYINPRVKLGDMINVLGTTLNVNNSYKVIGLEFTLGTNYRCKAELLRTVPIENDVDSIMYDNISVLLEAVTGQHATINDIVQLSASDEVIVQNNIGAELTELETALDGGV